MVSRLRGELRDALAGGELDGYTEAAPRGGLGEGIDAQVAATATCTACGHAGLGFRPFTRRGSYRAFSVCPACGHSEEF